MKHFTVLLLLLIAGSCWADTLLERQVKIQARIKALPDKKAALEVKTYSGTFEEVLAARIIDLNDVVVEAQTIVTDCNQLGKDAGLGDPPIGVVIAKLTKVVDPNIQEKKRLNNRFLRDVNEAFTDPNGLPDTNDPNYTIVLQEHLETIAWLSDVLANEPELGGL